MKFLITICCALSLMSAHSKQREDTIIYKTLPYSGEFSSDEDAMSFQLLGYVLSTNYLTSTDGVIQTPFHICNLKDVMQISVSDVDCKIRMELKNIADYSTIPKYLKTDSRWVYITMPIGNNLEGAEALVLGMKYEKRSDWNDFSLLTIPLALDHWVECSTYKIASLLIMEELPYQKMIL